jgi:hypothetical protein
MPCDHCIECAEKGDRFCEFCGSPIKKPSFIRSRVFANICFSIGLIITVLCSCKIGFDFAVAWWGSPNVFGYLADKSYPIFVIVPMLIDLFYMQGTVLQIYYVLLLVAITISLALLFYHSFSTIGTKPDERGRGFQNSALYEMTVLYAAVLFLEIVFIIILNACGVETGGYEHTNTWKEMFSLLNASVWEEVITRVLYLGIPMLIIALARNDKTIPLWKYPLGGFGINRLVAVFIVFSAIMFGAGHLTNWGLWKFFPTFIAGLCMGYLFAKYGLYASIAMHFLTDYMSAEMWLTGSTAMPLTGVFMIFVCFLGIPFVIVYCQRLKDYAKDLLKGT